MIQEELDSTARRRRSINFLRLALAIAAICALTLLLLSEGTHRRITELMSDIRRAHEMRTTIDSLVRSLTEAESNQRGFILTGDRRYLESYENALTHIRTDRMALEAGSIAPISQTEVMLNFRNFMMQKIAEMALTVRMREDDRTEVVNFVVNSDVGREQMKAFQAQGTELLARTDALIAERRVELQRLLNFSRFGLAAGVLAAFLAFFLYVNQIRASQRESERQQSALEAERDALESQVRERTARLTQLATHLQQAVEVERAHLARELHDELGALLTAAKLDVARLKSRLPPEAVDLGERLKHLTETLNQGIALKRRIIEDLRPSSLSNLGLVASLEILAREFADRSGIPVETALEPVDLDDASELTIYRMVQEALTNIGKYAQAKHIRIILKNYVYHAEVMIADDGRGFDPRALPVSSHGLEGMRHRVEAAGGRMEINSRPGSGTRITGTIPRRRARDQSELASATGAMSVNSYSRDAITPTSDAARD